MSDQIAVELRDGVLRVKFDREAKKNAITREMYEALDQAFQRAATEDDIGSVLLEGGDEILTAGNDLMDFMRGIGLDAQEKPPVWRFIESVITCPKPIVAAVSGGAIGIGTTILLHCDLIYADETAYFHMPFTDLATVPEAAASYITPRRFGRQIAGEFILLGEKVSAQRAYDMGVVNAIIHGDVRAHAFSIAQRLAAKPPSALRKSKELMYSDQSELLEHLETEMIEFGRCLQSEEMQGVIAKKLAKK